jgi:hypothetical protein
MSTPMVQATKARLKRMTRRLKGLENINNNPLDWRFDRFEINAKGGLNAVFVDRCGFLNESIPCPYGQPGDILWVRESYQWMDGFAGWDYYVFKADFQLKNGEWVKEVENKFHDVEVVRKWKPSIFMPKSAARIWLRVTDTRVEQLHDISQDDIIAEGVCYGEEYNSELCKWRDSLYGIHQTRKKFWEKTWRSINGDESWDANPWVWVVSFEVLSTTGKPENI